MSPAGILITLYIIMGVAVASGLVGAYNADKRPGYRLAWWRVMGAGVLWPLILPIIAVVLVFTLLLPGRS